MECNLRESSRTSGQGPPTAEETPTQQLKTEHWDRPCSVAQRTPLVAWFYEPVRLARPKHWVKNVIIFLPVIFGGQLLVGTAWMQAAIAAAAFSLTASAIYVINDIKDRQQDREHPVKRHRPLASGKMTCRAAVVEAVILVAAVLASALVVNQLVFCVVIAYVLLQLAYTLYLKQKMIVDVMCIATGFVLRAAAGAMAIGVQVSPWLVACTFTICSFMGFCKRRSEIAGIDSREEAVRHRGTLLYYTPELLTHLITLSAGIAVVSYMLYATSPSTIERFGTDCFIYTLPFVLYSVFRFTMLSIQARYSDPTELILNDRPFQIASVLWLACVTAIVLWGNAMQTWLTARW